jgi:hypothetical protein
MILRHLLAVAVFPFTVAVIVPAAIARRARVAPALGGSPGDVAMQVAGAVVLLAGLALFLASLRRFAAEGDGTLAPRDPPRRLVVQGHIATCAIR